MTELETPRRAVFVNDTGPWLRCDYCNLPSLLMCWGPEFAQVVNCPACGFPNTVTREDGMHGEAEYVYI